MTRYALLFLHISFCEDSSIDLISKFSRGEISARAEFEK